MLSEAESALVVGLIKTPALPIGRLSCLFLALAGLTSGCGKASPAAILRTGGPSEAAAKVMELHDSNKDGKLDKQELSAVPSLAGSVRHIDANRDGAIDLAEMQARFEAHDKMPDLASFVVEVSTNRVRLAGAEVTYTPESFMGEGKQSYVGTTSENGVCGLKGEEANVPGVPMGFYQV